jgi:hypothetical protein
MQVSRRTPRWPPEGDLDDAAQPLPVGGAEATTAAIGAKNGVSVPEEFGGDQPGRTGGERALRDLPASWPGGAPAGPSEMRPRLHMRSSDPGCMARSCHDPAPPQPCECAWSRARLSRPSSRYQTRSAVRQRTRSTRRAYSPHSARPRTASAGGPRSRRSARSRIRCRDPRARRRWSRRPGGARRPTRPGESSPGDEDDERDQRGGQAEETGHGLLRGSSHRLVPVCARR